MRILIVDDEPSDRLILRGILREIENCEVVEADSLTRARGLIETGTFDAAIIDLRLGDDLRNRDGHTLIRELRQRTRVAPIVWTASREMHEVREAMRNGAYDYIFKDAPYKELVARVIEGLRSRQLLEREVLEHRSRRALEHPVIHKLVGNSIVMQRLREDIKAIAVGSDKPVFVLGPSGSGKELVAQAIHALGPHPDAPFVVKNCAAVPESLFESELFGHEPHAFTGARRRAGALAATRDGTLFLDEIGEMPLTQQAKLLRVLESRRYAPVGADVEQPFHGRIVAATLVDIDERVRTGLFRRDLFMRLSFFPIRVPALREHAGDIPSIIEHYFRQNEIRDLRFSALALDALQACEWPGNVRELQHVLERIAVRPPTDGLVQIEHLTASIMSPSSSTVDLIRSTARAIIGSIGPKNAAISDELADTRTNLIEEMSAALLLEAMACSDNKKAKAARVVGTHRRVVERFLRKGVAGINTPSEPPEHSDDDNES